jgi:hypothetical protein
MNAKVRPNAKPTTPKMTASTQRMCSIYRHTSVVAGAKAAADATRRAETTAVNFMVIC